MTASEKARLTEALASVREAISRVEVAGQSYKIGSRQLTRAEYNSLIARETALMAELATEDNGSLFPDTYVAVFEGR